MQEVFADTNIRTELKWFELKKKNMETKDLIWYSFSEQTGEH